MDIVTARRIITMTQDRPQAFACRDEWIAATGTVDELRDRFPGSEVHDFGDATITPGFNDAHQHPTICAEQSLQVDMTPERVRGMADVSAALRDRAAWTPRGAWIVGFGYDPFRSNGGTELTRRDIDAACPDHPVLIVHVNLHTGVLNTPALALAGLRTADDAPGGGELGTDAAGQLTGVVHDQALYDVAFPAFTRRATVVPAPSAADLRLAYQRFAASLHAAGITSAGDALVGPAGWELMRAIDADGGLPLRVNALVAREHFGYFRPLGPGSGPEPAPGSGPAPGSAARLRLGGVKVFADGAVNGGTCLVEEPVIGAAGTGSGGHGIERMSAAELSGVVREVHDAGWRVCVHANGDRAITRVLDAVALAAGASPRRDVRHRIEHASLVTPEILTRMRDLGVVAVPFANYAMAHGDKLRQYYGPERAERMFAHRAMLDHGIPVAGSSDYPCGPYPPLFGMQSCVTRLDPTGAPFGRSQRISAAEALALYTTGSAYASAEERTKGRLAPGYLADFVVLGDDPLATGPERIAAIPVLETWIGGKRAWSAAGGTQARPPAS